MKILNILTSGFSSPNQRAFLFPLIYFREEIERNGIKVKFYSSISSGIYDCDYLGVDSKFFSGKWNYNEDEVLEEISFLSDQSGGLIYFDVTDSSGFDHAKALPYVTVYAKSQLLIDREAYLQSMIGHRIYADYYARAHQLSDFDDARSLPISKRDHLDRMIVSWNSGLADYSLWGPSRMAAYQFVALKSLLSLPGKSSYTKPSNDRPNEASIRIGINYSRETVAFQRKKIAEILKKKIRSNKINRRDYLHEIAISKVVVSPFGLGEITLRDFEIFMSGALLLKPSMSHMETWPNFFEDNVTMLTHSWDLEGFEEVLERICDHYADYIDIAAEGQQRYFDFVSGPKAGELFVEKLLSILSFYDGRCVG